MGGERHTAEEGTIVAQGSKGLALTSGARRAGPLVVRLPGGRLCTEGLTPAEQEDPPWEGSEGHLAGDRGSGGGSGCTVSGWSPAGGQGGPVEI